MLGAWLCTTWPAHPNLSFPGPRDATASSLGVLPRSACLLWSRRIPHFQAQWCRDGRERDEKRWRRQSAAARRRRRADRGNWHPRNPIPGPDGRLEHAIRRAQLTPLLRLCLPCSSPPCLRIRPCPLGGTHLSAPASCPPLGISPFVPRCYSAPFIDQRTIARAFSLRDHLRCRTAACCQHDA